MTIASFRKGQWFVIAGFNVLFLTFVFRSVGRKLKQTDARKAN